MSIGRALNCRKRIQQYVAEHDIGCCDALSRHDWKVLEKVHSTLHCYYEATLCCEGNNHSFGRWFPILDYIFSRSLSALCEFRGLKEENPECQEYVWLEAAADSAWQKCKRYYNLADDSAAYYAAEVLQPGRKWNWFCEQWGNDPQKKLWLKKTQEAVRKLWEEEYRGRFGTPEPTPEAPQSRDQHPDDEFGALDEHLKIKTGRPALKDFYQSYINRDVETGEDTLDYWNSRLLSQPDLARFALDMLAIPLSSSECERIFSSAKLLITPSRNRLLPDVIEANECLRNWFGTPEKAGKRVVNQDQDRESSVNEEGPNDKTGDSIILWGDDWESRGEEEESTCDDGEDEDSE
jgi:hypothetical protein